MERKVINSKHFSFWSLKNWTFSVLSPKACPYAMVLSFGGLFDEIGVLHVVEAGVEKPDLGNYGQGEE